MSSVLSCPTDTKAPATTKCSESVLFISFKVFERIEDLPEAWDDLIQTENLLLSTTYLSVLDHLHLPNFKFKYVVFYSGYTPIGIAYFQEMDFWFVDSMNNVSSNFNKKIILPLADQILKIKMLICGSVFLTGEYGFFFKPEKIKPIQQYNWIIKAAHHLKSKSRSNILLIKDQFEINERAHAFLKDQKFSDSTMQPSMVLNLESSWTNFDDYLNAMTSKYRVRARRARKQNKEVVKKELDAGQSIGLSKRLDRLYHEIAGHADFNVAYLPANYFAAFKEAFPERFRIFAYYFQEKLIGFSTTFLNHETLEAHFLGFEREMNTKFQLYLNMLYDMVEIGIESRVSQINFARTALEIKSSIGAIPQYFNSYVKHTGKFANFLMPYVIERFEPEVKWVQRKPFKN